jgi:hypothetical protein
MAVYTAVNDAGSFFNTKLYSGTGSDQDVTGVGFQPNWLWAKCRNGTNNHMLMDSVRGGALDRINSNTTAAQITSDPAVAFLSDGFSVVAADGGLNDASGTYASWNWKATTTSGIATDGSTTITPSAYSFDQTAGISIIAYTGNGSAGAKLAHGLGAVPACILIKRLDGISHWAVYHESMGNTAYLLLNGSTIKQTNIIYWNDTSPDSVNITLGTEGDVNGSSGTMVAYCFADVQGFSKFGTYDGNDQTDGPFIHLGFRPAYVMIKKTSASGADWEINDDKRPGYNVTNESLLANQTDVTDTTITVDLLSNGFKPRLSGRDDNHIATYIYLAFASAPFVNAEGVPVNAR